MDCKLGTVGVHAKIGGTHEDGGADDEIAVVNTELGCSVEMENDARVVEEKGSFTGVETGMETALSTGDYIIVVEVAAVAVEELAAAVPSVVIGPEKKIRLKS
ncbi:unnamed protein product [Cuscuta epithymum]|uniref:Uncharacterized protein n=1 Tax=Cuscuta epithymum TaxID=186058 RepID=A0AAV0DNU9_9ASTE|nr:unnamed protein product [Cuscuta epithymum]